MWTRTHASEQPTCSQHAAKLQGILRCEVNVLGLSVRELSVRVCKLSIYSIFTTVYLITMAHYRRLFHQRANTLWRSKMRKMKSFA